MRARKREQEGEDGVNETVSEEVEIYWAIFDSLTVNREEQDTRVCVQERAGNEKEKEKKKRTKGEKEEKEERGEKERRRSKRHNTRPTR